MDDYAGSLTEPQSLHKYAYCHGDPVNGVDPSGLRTFVEVMVTGFIISLLGAIVAGVTVGALTGNWKFGVWAAWATLKLGMAITLLVAQAGAGTFTALMSGLISLSAMLVTSGTSPAALGTKSSEEKWRFGLGAFDAFTTGMLIAAATMGLLKSWKVNRAIWEILKFLRVASITTPAIAVKIAWVLSLFGVPAMAATFVTAGNEGVDAITGENGGFQTGNILIAMLAGVLLVGLSYLAGGTIPANQENLIGFVISVVKTEFDQLFGSAEFRRDVELIFREDD